MRPVQLCHQFADIRFDVGRIISRNVFVSCRSDLHMLCRIGCPVMASERTRHRQTFPTEPVAYFRYARNP